MIDPIIKNDFNFESKKYILDVDCPIMMLHAKDDTIIPFRFATEVSTKLYSIGSGVALIRPGTTLIRSTW